MKPVHQFKVFGEPVEILVTTEATRGSFCIMTQTSPPGGGPPPHVHSEEDEIFRVLEGDFELFNGKTWSRVPLGETIYTLRGQVHTFRNCGTTPGKMLVICTPGGLDRYLEAISPLSIPADLPRLTEISTAHGITFVSPDPPQVAPL